MIGLSILLVNPNDHAYQSYRAYTTLGIEGGTLAWGGYGLAKGGLRLVLA